MKTKSLLLTLAAVSAVAFLATPAQAGSRHKNRCGNDNAYRYGGWNNSYYYQPASYYYQPVRYVPVAPYGYYAPRPAFQIGFSFGGNNRGYCR